MLNLKDFKLNKEGLYSITRPYESTQIIKIIKTTVKSLESLIVTDATACMGGDLVCFSKEARLVNGIEIDPTNFKYLTENCKRFKCQNVNLFCQDYLDIYAALKQDVIYMDPPWGGVDYKTKRTVSLKLTRNDGTTVELWKVLKEIRELAKYIFVKVPLNICLDHIEYDEIVTIYNRNRCDTFKLLIIKPNCLKDTISS